jgi:hypothetical protein
MDTDETTVRRFLTILFYKRAQRHLRTLAEAYQLSPERLAELEERFLVTADCAPVFVPLAPLHQSSSAGE